jgi:signal transduction histidine kinase
MPTFTVDTHVFRELGELLVGRDSTALVELIKNSYDADATSVVVYGEKLSNPSSGTIVVSDDGTGMDVEAFTSGFLRIASRTKDSGNRRSQRFKRRFTGAKGIGRLAAHKLASIVEVESFSTSRGPEGGVQAAIYWDRVEAKETLEEVDGSDAVSVKPLEVARTTKSGTRISLRNLRRRWTKSEHSRFLEEVQSFQVQDSLKSKLPSSVLKQKLLFDTPTIRDEQVNADFSVKLEGDLAPPDDYWTAVVDAAHWILEIDALTDPGSVRFGIAPTNKTLAEIGEFDAKRYRLPHPGGNEGPRFQARILIRSGAAKGSEETRSWKGRTSGIRVFMEGFRVLPYGEASNDWLRLDRDYAQRSNEFVSDEIAKQLTPQLTAVNSGERPGLLTLPNRSYVGAVFLTQNNAATLRTLVNREGFIPDQPYEHLVDILRLGIDLATRTRSTATHDTRLERRQERAQLRRQISSQSASDPLSFSSVLAEAERHVSAAKRLVSAGKTEAAARQMDAGLTRIKFASETSTEYSDQYAMVRVLASIGTHLSSFVHELNGLLGMAESIEGVLNRFIESSELPRPMRSELREIAKATGDLRRQVERNASYLVDVVSVDAIRRRSRQSLYPRVQSAIKLVQTAADRRSIQIANLIPEELKSPPMFPAELTTIFANLLTNAIKAAGKKGKIKVHARSSNDHTVLRVENTGKAVNVRNSERWFKPFESSSSEIDPVLGQGMGLGLTITRAMLEEYGATIKFVKPSRGFSTALEVTLNA